MSLLESYDRFFHYLQAVCNFSEHTLRNYLVDLNSFKNFLEEKIEKLPLEKRAPPFALRFLGNREKLPFDPLSPQRVNKRTIREYLAHLSYRGLSKRTIVRHLSTLRSFFKYLMKEKEVIEDPLEEIETLKLDKPLPKALSYDQIKHLFDQPD
ncbi:MAG: site-specific integrase, partial [Simkania negevensis]|nr:site-specific integrase [Simkania negevensis]